MESPMENTDGNIQSREMDGLIGFEGLVQIDGDDLLKKLSASLHRRWLVDPDIQDSDSTEVPLSAHII
jgi:hypothetical protein